MTKIREGYKETDIGIIPKDWNIEIGSKVFHTVTDFVANGSFASLKENVRYYNEKEYAILVRLTDFKNNYKGEHIYVDKESYDFLNKSSLKPNDILIANVGANAGFVYRTVDLDKPMTLGPNSILVRTLLNNEFIYQYLSSQIGQKQLNNIITITAQPKFNKTDFKKINIALPPPPEQQRIAEILSTTDEHIEKLDKIIEDYQLLKKGMMQKLLTEGIGHTEFKETEIGRIPKEWEVDTLSSIIVSTQLGVNEKASETNKGIPLIKMGNLTIGDFDFSKLEKIEDNKIDNYSSYILNYGDFLFNTRNTPELVGKSATWRYNKNTSIFNSNIMRISFNSLIDTFWMKYYFSIGVGWKSLKKISTGTTSVAAIYTKDLVKILIPIPPLSEQQQIAEILLQLDNKIELYNKEQQDFIQLKKALMEKLLTGKIRVSSLKSEV